MLGHIVSFMRNVVVTGSHGKTTTTSLVSNIFTSGNLDPTIINGGVLNSFGNSAKLGKVIGVLQSLMSQMEVF